MNRLPSPQDIQQLLPLSENAKTAISHHIQSIKHILDGKDKRKLFIIGPCSIHSVEKGLEYAQKLKDLADEVSDTIFIVMRAHVEKPRTQLGWKGLIYDPRLDGSNDIQLGILKTRRFFLEMAELGMPISTEILDPFLYLYYIDLISYGVIGARTSTSQVHRQIASHLSIPVGVKNSVDGNIDTAVHGISFARAGHSFVSFLPDGSPASVISNGNPYTHLILRGSHLYPNFDANSLIQSTNALKTHHIPMPIMIDCSHGNRIENQQVEAFSQGMNYMLEETFPIGGLMLESYLQEGRYCGKDIQNAPMDLSITDHCMNFEKTAYLIRNASESLSRTPITAYDLM
ncbi:MAG: 3-deoxy-7-phosphoheptulonate synthase [Simkaniaceae bacterium]|nr:3-deoxy-7-phosphoheptulonate synthase [Simkaniaceae bacterium]